LHVSKKNVIDKNEITGNNAGITQGLSNSNTIVNNVVSKNNGGFFLYKSNENQIKNNTLSSNNEHGILLRYSDSNTLGSNSGIRIVDYSTNNAIINNCLSGNEQDIIANESENTIVASADDNNPDNDNKNNNSLVQSCGDIKYVMLFGNYSHPITIEDVKKATISVLESSQKEKSNSVVTICTKPGISSEEIILAYCISADENGLTSTYAGKTSIEDESQDERTIEIIHGKAQEWYEKEVLGMKLNPDEQDVMDTSSDIVLEKKEVIIGVLSVPDHLEGNESNNNREISGSICNLEWIPIKFPLLTW
jgi:parallel beta-helix repeat protein